MDPDQGAGEALAASDTIPDLCVSDSSNPAQDLEATEPSHGGYLFIASTGQKATTRDRKHLKTVRTHVMQNYLDKVNSKPELEHSAITETDPPKVGNGVVRVGSRGQKMRFRLTPGGLQQKLPLRQSKARRRVRDGENERDRALHNGSQHQSVISSPLPITWLSAHKSDPFQTLPIHLDASDELLLNRFRTIERWPWCPINGQGMWPQFAFSDRLVFHVTLYSFGMHFRGRKGAGFVIESTEAESELRILQHKLAAISLINSRLSDFRQATGDECIAAVAALTNMALVMDSHEEAKKHMQGLKTIIDMRGGLLALGDGVQRHVQRLTSFNDLIYSELFDEELRFPPLVQVWEESWSTLDEPEISGSLPGLGHAELRLAGIQPHPVLEVLEDIRQLCYSEQTKPLSRADDVGRMIRGDVCLRLERRLRLILQSATLPDSKAVDATVWRCTALAALIYVHHHLRGNPLRYRHFGILSTQLYGTLLTMDDELAELDFAPAMAIWILSVGATTSPEPQVRSGFVKMLREACMRFGLVDWPTFWWTMTRFLSIGEGEEERYSKLWRELDPWFQGWRAA